MSGLSDWEIPHYEIMIDGRLVGLFKGPGCDISINTDYMPPKIRVHPKIQAEIDAAMKVHNVARDRRRKERWARTDAYQPPPPLKSAVWHCKRCYSIARFDEPIPMPKMQCLCRCAIWRDGEN
jgi:hypothetical protein